MLFQRVSYNVQVDVQTGQTELLSKGAAHGRAAAVGMQIDAMSRLWVCGGSDNKIQVLNLDGTLIKSWDTKLLFNSGFINDCTIDGKHVYFTDSRVKKIYRASVTENTPGEPEEWLAFSDEQIPYVAAGFNANGIVSTPDSKYLIIVLSSSGKLFRIDKTNKAISEIQLTTPVTSGDGMYLIANILYVSRNMTGQIYPVVLNNSYTQGTVGNGFGSELLFNTTMAKAGDYFLVVNGQLNKMSTNNPQLPFTISRVLIP